MHVPGPPQLVRKGGYTRTPFPCPLNHPNSTIPSCVVWVSLGAPPALCGAAQVAGPKWHQSPFVKAFQRYRTERLLVLRHRLITGRREAQTDALSADGAAAIHRIAAVIQPRVGGTGAATLWISTGVFIVDGGGDWRCRWSLMAGFLQCQIHECDGTGRDTKGG